METEFITATYIPYRLVRVSQFCSAQIISKMGLIISNQNELLYYYCPFGVRVKRATLIKRYGFN